MMSPAGGRHGWIASRLNRLLGSHVDTYHLGAVFAAETGFLISRDPDTVRAPDVAFLSTAKLSEIDDLDGFLPVAPDLVAEVVFPSDSSFHVEAKAEMWIDVGVRMVLVVAPFNHSLRVYRDQSRVDVFHAGDEMDASDVVPGWKLAIADLFP